MKSETRSSDANPDSPWREVRHALGRLLSYFIAIKVLISARKFWPRLFVDFVVTYIPSSRPLADPPPIRRNAEGIINRMGRKKELIDSYKRHAAGLQKEHRLDERIRQRVSPARFRPIVHAEVNLLASVLRDMAAAEAGGDDPIRFFAEATFGRYVGSSKPTCLLCSLYFAAHPLDVRCRDSHGNLYYNWRTPDVPRRRRGTAGAAGSRNDDDDDDDDDGEAGDSDGIGDAEEASEAARQRDEIMERMIKDVRAKTTLAITQRSYTRSRHDSRDTPTNPLQSTRRGSTVADDLASTAGQASWDVSSVRSGGISAQRGWLHEEEAVKLAARMGQVSLGAPSPRDRAESSRETTPEALAPDEGEDDEDDDAGGALL
jgi:hypothetical protein